jgi:predicted nucleic acid-binding protein
VTILVLDSSAVVALLVDDGEAGAWVADQVADCDFSGPELLPFEAANVLRRLSLSGVLSTEEAALAHADLLDLPVETWPYVALARHAWELRGALTVYDASYVAVAQVVDAPLITLDRRLARAGVTHCEIRCAPGVAPQPGSPDDRPRRDREDSP